jgi:hypothetical protein
MRRSWPRFRGRRSGWPPTPKIVTEDGRLITDRQGSDFGPEPVGMLTPWTHPSPNRRLSGGFMVELSILARLLGLRLLRLDARLSCVPAHMDLPAGLAGSVPHDGGLSVPATVSATSGDLDEAARLLGHAGRTIEGVRRASLDGARPR